jgi:GIY-YIG catalytic domain
VEVQVLSPAPKFPQEILPRASLLICSDHSFYKGMTNDLRTRIKDHVSAKGGGYTKSVHPQSLSGFNFSLPSSRLSR